MLIVSVSFSKYVQRVEARQSNLSTPWAQQRQAVSKWKAGKRQRRRVRIDRMRNKGRGRRANLTLGMTSASRARREKLSRGGNASDQRGLTDWHKGGMSADLREAHPWTTSARFSSLGRLDRLLVGQVGAGKDHSEVGDLGCSGHHGRTRHHTERQEQREATRVQDGLAQMIQMMQAKCSECEMERLTTRYRGRRQRHQGPGWSTREEGQKAE